MTETVATAGCQRLVDLPASVEGSLKRTLLRLLPINRLLSVDAINRIYAQSHIEHRGGTKSFFRTALDIINISYNLADEDWARIPPQGPLVIVANHPFGAVDGLILGDLLSKARPDFLLLGNHLLGHIPEIRDRVVPVDPFGGENATAANVAPLRKALRHLKNGGAIATFPSGTVSHLQISRGRVADPPWQLGTAWLVRRSGATVLPVFFDGRNSATFQLAGLLHPLLRTVLLASELVKRSNSSIPVRIEQPIDPAQLARFTDDETLIQYLRFKTYVSKWRSSPVKPRFIARPATPEPAPIAPATPAALLAAEVASLPAQNLLHQHGDLTVYVASANEIPQVLQEIGRLRERTFREVSEGTGLSRDLDNYDLRYRHLFLWNSRTRDVVGSYRLGHVDELLDSMGPRGLYTSTLFDFKPEFLRKVRSSLELGRSFIRAEYQRKPTSLALIWRGIGEYLVRNPRYSMLFGPVSISRDYASLSRKLMVGILGKRYAAADLATLVRPRNPPRERLAREERATLERVIGSVEDLSAVVSDIEEDGKGLPILLRHYLRLNARLLSFNVDPAFGNCLDGLIVVDLRTTDPRILRRFMGDSGYERFVAESSVRAPERRHLVKEAIEHEGHRSIE